LKRFLFNYCFEVTSMNIFTRYSLLENGLEIRRKSNKNLEKKKKREFYENSLMCNMN